MMKSKNKLKFPKMKIPIINSLKKIFQLKNQILKINKLKCNKQMMIDTYTIFILKKQDFR